MQARHTGSKTMSAILTDVHLSYPNLTDIVIYGGSGGGVSSSAWLPIIADMWPEANVTGLVDSGFHIFPGSKLFQDFYDKSAWGPGPAGQGNGTETGFEVPDFDWREADAVARHVASFDGRVKIAYLACIDDDVVYQDRGKLASYANLGTPLENLLDHHQQHEDTWNFIATLHHCTPQGSSFSYIQNCSNHHQTRNGFAVTNPDTTVTPKQFVERILNGQSPDPTDATRTQFWYKSVANKGADCNSAVRRRRDRTTAAPTTTATTRAAATATTTKAPTTTPTTEAPAPNTTNAETKEAPAPNTTTAESKDVPAPTTTTTAESKEAPAPTTTTITTKEGTEEAAATSTAAATTTKESATNTSTQDPTPEPEGLKEESVDLSYRSGLVTTMLVLVSLSCF